jgi:hypothetical protein
VSAEGSRLNCHVERSEHLGLLLWALAQLMIRDSSLRSE